MAKGRVEVSRKDTDALLGYVTVSRWLRELRPWTKRHCLRNMVRFSRIAKRDPDQFLLWAKTQDSVEVQDLIDRAAEGLTLALQALLKADIRSFLRHNGYNNLPKSRLKYTPKDWHRGYRKEEVRKLLSYLDNTVHKLAAYIAIESGLRAQAILDIRYRHIREDFEKGIIPVAIRFEPEFYARQKAAGFCFLGPRSIAVLKEYVGTRKLKDEDPLVPLKYNGIYDALTRAKQKAKLDPKIQVLHGFRKYFENALDKAEIDENPKAVIEGHFAGTRARSYTDREWDQLRPIYKKAYAHIDPEGPGPEIAETLHSWEEEKRQLLQRITNLELLVGARQEPEPTDITRAALEAELELAAKKRGVTMEQLMLEFVRGYVRQKPEKKEKKDGR